jgi:four helix bundle protein
MPRTLGFRDLDVWQRSMDLVIEVYRITRAFPQSELYGLTAQMRRAAASVPANIAEGNGRLFRKEYAHHVSIARGSIAELSTCLEISQRLRYVSPALVSDLLKLADDISRMLLMLVRALDKPARSAHA